MAASDYASNLPQITACVFRGVHRWKADLRWQRLERAGECGSQSCMMITTLLAALASVSVSDTDPDILFSKYQSLGGHIDTVEIWLRATSKDGELASPKYVLRRTVSYRPDIFPPKWQARKTILWASDKTCPQTLKLMEALMVVQIPAIKIAEIPSDRDYAIIVRADGAQYRLAVPGYYPGYPGKIDLAFGADTPIANWIDEGFRTVAPCWQSERPKQAE